MRNYSEKIDRTMFDFSAYYQKIAEQLPDNCRVCEVGVANGASSIFLAEAILNLGKTIERFVLVDSLAYGGAKQLQTILNHVIQSGIKEFEVLPLNSLDASCEFPDGYFDFVFIDASHTFEGTKADIRLWHKKVKDDCYISGHDANMEEVKMALDNVIPKETKYPKSFDSDIPLEEWEELFHIIETEKGYGVWEIKKHPALQIL